MKDGLVYRQPSIFIADDDDDDVYFVRAALRELDPQVTLKHFQNGRQLLQAIVKAEDQFPSMILLDLNMPMLDGRETLRLIREKFSAAHLPVIVLSTSNHGHEKEICFEYGANGYFTKPCNYSSYLEIIRKLKTEWIDKVEA